MSGISQATVIVEAGETSGALKQADFAIKQKHLMFIPQSAIDNTSIAWPKKYLTRPNVRSFSHVNELLCALQDNAIIHQEVDPAALQPCFSEA